ncbi:MAG: Hpt domain-containing protein [Firmicutes bacterium]|nr:Hpt domain-containing protein [Bacillota bacterium]
MLEQYGINVATGTARFSGNTALYHKYLKRFPEDENFNKLTAALETSDAEAAYHAAHTIKGVAGNLSVDSVFEASLPLNEALKAGDIARGRELYIEFKALYDRACEGIKKFFGM